VTRHSTEDGEREDTPLPIRNTLSSISALPDDANANGGPTARDVAETLFKLMPNGGSPPSSPPPPPKTFLGVLHSKWVMMIAGLLVGGVGLTLTWVLFVRDDLKSLRGGQEHHKVHGHDETNKSIGDIQKVQAIQGEKLNNIERGIGEIKDKLK